MLQEFDRTLRERRERQARVDAEQARSVEQLNAVFQSINVPQAAE